MAINYRVICAAYLATVSGMILALVARSDELLLLFSLLATPLSIAVAVHIAVKWKFYTVILFFCHMIMYFFTLYVYFNRERLLEVRCFDFSVLTNENMAMALILLAITVGEVAFISLILGKRSFEQRNVHLFDMLLAMLGRLVFVRAGTLLVLLALSALTGIILFALGTSVFQMPYPYNILQFPLPYESLMIPPILGAIVLAAAHVRRLTIHSHDSPSLSVLALARINFVGTPILCLMIAGSRGFTTFLWVTVSLLEIYLATKRKNTFVWGAIFLGLGYLSFMSWPFLRWYLATMPIGDAVVGALMHALWLENVIPDAADGNLIDLSAFPMLGQSLFHLLYSIQLIAQGQSLAGSTFLNLIPQALPRFFDGLVWQRPLNDNWLLGDYYTHVGGFLSIANAYWNGGTVVMAAFVAFITVAFLYFDNHLVRPGTSTFYKLVYFAFVPIVIVQLFYGIQGLARPLEFLVLIVLAEKLFGVRIRNLKGKKRIDVYAR